MGASQRQQTTSGAQLIFARLVVFGYVLRGLSTVNSAVNTAIPLILRSGKSLLKRIEGPVEMPFYQIIEIGRSMIE
jgi:hypothetical protein